MNNKPLASFDLEVARTVDFTRADLGQPHIACLSVAFEDGQPTKTWQGRRTQAPGHPNWLTDVEARWMVMNLLQLTDKYTLVSVNGTSFDLRLVAQESQMVDAAKTLAMGHIDLMAIVVARRGHRLGLDAIARGAGVPAKRHTVTLADGRLIDNMDGARAPEMWEAGEYEAVLEYLQGDVNATLAAAIVIRERGTISWVSSKGYTNSVRLSGLSGGPALYSVETCLSLPLERPGAGRQALTVAALLDWSDVRA